MHVSLRPLSFRLAANEYLTQSWAEGRHGGEWTALAHNVMAQHRASLTRCSPKLVSSMELKFTSLKDSC